MIIYKIYRDYSDEFNQYFKEFGYFHDREKAFVEIEKIIRKQEKEIDEIEMKNLYEDGVYIVDWIGHYGIEEIEVK